MTCSAVRACRSRLWLSVGLQWSELAKLNSGFRFGRASGEGTRCSSLDGDGRTVLGEN